MANSDTDDILKEILDSNLPKLLDLYRDNWPNNLNAYYFVNNYIDWKKKDVTNIKFYCPDGNFDDGTIIAIEKNVIDSIFVYTLEKNSKRLQEALRKTKIIKWNESEIRLFFVTVHGDHYPMLKNELKFWGKDKLLEDNGQLWWISKDEARGYEFEIPVNYHIAPLQEKDVDIINPVWPHYSEFSHIYLKQLILNNGGVGLFSKENNELCAWIMHNNYGCLAILQTAEKYKRRGLGELMAKYYSKYFAEQGKVPFCFIMKKNTVSQNLFKKLGFRTAHDISWIQCVNKPNQL